MKRALIAVAGVAALVLIASPLAAQGRRGLGWGPGSAYNRLYDVKTEATISGTITSLDRIEPQRGMSPGVHALVKTAGGVEDVHLGPAWYVDAHQPALKTGDAVTVVGSRATVEGKAALIAREVRCGPDTLVLRNTAGYPVWAGRNKR